MVLSGMNLTEANMTEPMKGSNTLSAGNQDSYALCSILVEFSEFSNAIPAKILTPAGRKL